MTLEIKYHGNRVEALEDRIQSLATSYKLKLSPFLFHGQGEWTADLQIPEEVKFNFKNDLKIISKSMNQEIHLGGSAV